MGRFIRQGADEINRDWWLYSYALPFTHGFDSASFKQGHDAAAIPPARRRDHLDHLIP
jgi:hypothetical protein